jgi:hypothetical protein
MNTLSAPDGQTPVIPAEIKGFKTQEYTNIYELVPGETRLYGTESLYGDWSGELLLLAKDFACSQYVQKLQDNGDPRPYSHNPKAPTNKNLIEYLSEFKCGMLYGSALVGLLRNDGKKSGTLPEFKKGSKVRQYACDVLRCFTIENMPNLRAIACLGDVAWDCALDSFEKPFEKPRVSFKQAREERVPIPVEQISLFALYHPAARCRKDSQIEDWQAMGTTMGFL